MIAQKLKTTQKVKCERKLSYREETRSFREKTKKIQEVMSSEKEVSAAQKPGNRYFEE